MCTAAGQTKQANRSFALTGGCVTVYRQQKGRKVCVCMCVSVCVCEVTVTNHV